MSILFIHLFLISVTHRAEVNFSEMKTKTIFFKSDYTQLTTYELSHCILFF